MRKFLVSVLFVVLAVLAMAGTASAQYIPQTPDGWYYRFVGNQVQMLAADNLGLVDGLTDQLRRAGYRSLARDIRWNGSVYGIPMGRGGFYPMYDRDRQPLSGRQRIERGAGIVAAADGVRRIVNNPRGAAGWIEAAVGAVLMNDSRYRGQPNNQRRDNGVIVTPPSEPPIYWSNGAPVAVGTRLNANRHESVSNPPSTAGDWRISNRTSKRVEVWDEARDPNRAIAVLGPGQQNVSVPPPQDPEGYKAVLVYSDFRSGRIVQENAQIRGNDNFNGWDIIAPAVQ